MAPGLVGGWIYCEETSHRVYEGFKASSEKVKSISHGELGPEFHHFFNLQSFLPSVLEEEGLKTDHDKDPEYEEAWTDTFYDLFLVAMMSKITRMVLEGITTGTQFSDVPNGVQDFQNFWHYGAVIGFILAFYGLWRALLYMQMHSRSNTKEDFITSLFILFQLILITVLCIAVFHIEVCPKAAEGGAEEAGEGGETAEPEAERRNEGEKLCVVYGTKYFGACIMLAHLMICMWHVLMTFHPKPEMALEEESLGPEFEEKADEVRVGNAMQKLTRRFSLLFAFKSLIWVLAGALHWAGAIKENDAKGSAVLYCCAYIFSELTDVLGDVFGGFKIFEKRRLKENGKWEWTTYKFIEDEAEKESNHYRIPIHVPFFNGRHKSLMAIAFGESILQLTGATNGEPWLPSFRSICVAICGLLTIYMQASMYFHNFTCVDRDHPINNSKLSKFIWMQLQPVVVVGLCLLGASFEAAWAANAFYDAATFDTTTAFGLGPAIKCFSYSQFLIAMASCAMGQVGQDRLRAFNRFPKITILFSSVIPITFNGMILVPQFIDSWKHDQMENQYMTMAAIVTISSIYHVRIMHQVFYSCANWKYVCADLKEESVNVCKEKLKFLKGDLEQQIEELQKQVKICDDVIANKVCDNSSQDSRSIKFPTGAKTDKGMKTDNPLASAKPNQDEDVVLSGL